MTEPKKVQNWNCGLCEHWYKRKKRCDAPIPVACVEANFAPMEWHEGSDCECFTPKPKGKD